MSVRSGNRGGLRRVGEAEFGEVFEDWKRVKVGNALRSVSQSDILWHLRRML